MATPDFLDEKRDIPSANAGKGDWRKRERRTFTLVIVGIVVIVVLYFFLDSYVHPFWRYQSGYVSQAQYGEDWPFTVKEARVVCIGQGGMLLETRVGSFGMTSGTVAMGYQDLNDANIWKFDPAGFQNRVPATSFWIYVNTLCK